MKKMACLSLLYICCSLGFKIYAQTDDKQDITLNSSTEILKQSIILKKSNEIKQNLESLGDKNIQELFDNFYKSLNNFLNVDIGLPLETIEKLFNNSKNLLIQAESAIDNLWAKKAYLFTKISFNFHQTIEDLLYYLKLLDVFYTTINFTNELEKNIHKIADQNIQNLFNTFKNNVFKIMQLNGQRDLAYRLSDQNNGKKYDQEKWDTQVRAVDNSKKLKTEIADLNKKNPNLFNIIKFDFNKAIDGIVYQFNNYM